LAPIQDGRRCLHALKRKRLPKPGARLIVIDPRRTDLVKSPHIEADHHLPLRPGTNVAMLTALRM